MRSTRRHDTSRTWPIVGGLLTLLLVTLMTAASGVHAGAVVAGDSDEGVVPIEYSEGRGGNVACAEIDELDGLVDDLASTDRRNWGGGGFDGAAWPEGVTVTVTGGTAVAWASTEFPLAAVIVKGGSAANVYVYAGLDDDVFADGGLVSPVNASGNPAGLSNLTFCWDAAWTPPEEPDLEQLCLQAAADAGIADIAWVAGPIEVRDGAVDQMTVPEGFTITFDISDEQVGFTAPDPVAMVITAASDPVTHPVSPPSTTGSVLLSSNPGAGDIVLCGLATPVMELSCTEVPDVIELGPVPIVAGEVDVALIPEEIVAIVPAMTGIEFVAKVPVVAAVVAASEPVLFPFEPPMREATIPFVVTDEDLVEVLFCATSVADDPTDPDDPVGPTPVDDPADDPVGPTPVDDPADDPVAGALADPTTIPTGGGLSGRSVLALLAFVVLGLTGSMTLLVWSRGG